MDAKRTSPFKKQLGKGLCRASNDHMGTEASQTTGGQKLGGHSQVMYLQPVHVAMVAARTRDLYPTGSRLQTALGCCPAVLAACAALGQSPAARSVPGATLQLPVWAKQGQVRGADPLPTLPRQWAALGRGQSSWLWWSNRPFPMWHHASGGKRVPAWSLQECY